MLYWQANFQIPNSGVQAAEVYVVSKQEENKIVSNFYSDNLETNLLFQKEYDANNLITDVEEYLLTLNDFLNYKKIQ
jgi:hypothetical protein